MSWLDWVNGETGESTKLPMKDPKGGPYEIINTALDGEVNVLASATCIHTLFILMLRVWVTRKE